jgi:hypothetical protein
MEPHQQRVVDEKAELDERRMKLDQFLKSEKSPIITIEERNRMERQESAMAIYSAILGERINAFAPAAAAPAMTVTG